MRDADPTFQKELGELVNKHIERNMKLAEMMGTLHHMITSISIAIIDGVKEEKKREVTTP